MVAALHARHDGCIVVETGGKSSPKVGFHMTRCPIRVARTDMMFFLAICVDIGYNTVLMLYLDVGTILSCLGVSLQ
jgi:hypothetical protein